MKWVLRLFSLLIPVALGIFIFKGAVSGREEPKKETEPQSVLRVETDTVRVQSLPRLLRGFGSVVAARKWTAIPQISGKVTNIHPNLKTGGTIAQGQVLFVIETIDQGLEQERILADRRALEAEIRQVDQRKIQLKQSLQAAQGSLRLLQKERDRYQKLFEAGATPASTVDARQREVLNQQRVIEDIESNITTLPYQVDAVRARISANRVNLQKQGVQIGRSVVRAPFNGRLGEVYLEVGQVVSAGAQLFQLQGSDELRVEARFPQAQLGAFPIKGATVTTPAGLELSAQVGPLREQIDPITRTASVQLTVASTKDASFIPGASVGVELAGDPHAPLPVIPRSALRNGQVFTVADGKLQRKRVEVAFREGDNVAIEQGLEEGEQLVISDPGLAMDGTLVQIAPQDR